MKPQQISKEFASWIDNRIASFTDPDRPEWQPIENYLQWNAMFVTFMFDKRKIAGRQSKMSDSSSPTPMQVNSPQALNIDRLYKRMCRSLLGSHYPRKREQQPLMIAGADVNGTRYWKTSGELQNQHVHSIWVFKPGQMEKAKGKFASIDLDTPEYDFANIDVKPIASYRRAGQANSAIASYVSKFLGFNAIDMRVLDDLLSYPEYKQHRII